MFFFFEGFVAFLVIFFLAFLRGFVFFKVFGSQIQDFYSSCFVLARSDASIVVFLFLGFQGLG